MALLTAIVVLGVLVADAFALVQVRRLSRTDLEERDPSDARDAGAVPAIDLGLGEDVRAQVAPATTAYRSRARPVALLLGSPGDARAALRRAILRGAVSAGIAGAVLAGHLWAETPAAYLAYQETRCEDTKEACYEAGTMLMPVDAIPASCPGSRFTGESAPAEDLPRGEALLRRSCEATHRCACDILRESYARRGSTTSLPSWYVPH
jgi:hypothetical protein